MRVQDECLGDEFIVHVIILEVEHEHWLLHYTNMTNSSIVNMIPAMR